jgi:hypothetical protein
MAEKNFSLKDIKLLADHYSPEGTPEALALFQVIQAYYSPGKNPNNRNPVDPLEVLKGLKKSGFQLEGQEENLAWLNSLREKLNRELFDIISRQENPADLLVGPDYTFTQVLENPQSRNVAPLSARKLLEYKIARGGSFITHYKHIALWQRISLLKSYCTSFLGFRTTCDDA